MIGEVAMEVLIPTLMALIIDKGVANGDMAYIWKMSFYLVGAAPKCFLYARLKLNGEE